MLLLLLIRQHDFLLNDLLMLDNDELLDNLMLLVDDEVLLYHHKATHDDLPDEVDESMDEVLLYDEYEQEML